MSRKIIFLFVLFLLSVLNATNLSAATASLHRYGDLPSLKINKNTFKPGEKIIVKFTAPSNWGSSAWIGIIPAEKPHGSEAENDKWDIIYQYIKNRTSGEMVFKAPAKEGQWDIRMHDNDSNGKEVAYVSFIVANRSVVNISSENKALELDKYAVKPGETITVSFIASSDCKNDAWIGIIPSHVPHGSEITNDKYDIQYQYLSGRKSGVMQFKAPAKLGEYDLRLNNSDKGGKEISSVTFIVTNENGSKPSIRLNKSTYSPGETIWVTFTALSRYPSNAWIGIIPASVKHGSEIENDRYDISYQYLNKKTSGQFKFTAPSKQGIYDFRMNDSDNNGNEVASVSFEVK